VYKIRNNGGGLTFKGDAMSSPEYATEVKNLSDGNFIHATIVSK